MLCFRGQTLNLHQPRNEMHKAALEDELTGVRVKNQSQMEKSTNTATLGPATEIQTLLRMCSQLGALNAL